MAFATKFRIQGTSDVFGQITVNIKLNDYAGSIIDLDAVGRNWINLKIGDNSSEMSSPILAGKLTFSFYVNSDFQTTEIGKAEPFTYYIEALDSSNVLIWAGWAMPEEYSEAYQNTPYIATVSASDGLDELKNVNYPLLDGKATLFTHIQNALVGTFVTNKFFESVNIYSNGMNSTAADSPLRQAQVTYNSFRTISETPKAYEVLSSLLVPFFCRIYQYRGWRIENILEKRSSYIVREYSSLGVYVGQSTFNPLVRFDTDYSTFKAFIQKSGQLSIRPALNNAEVYFNTIEPVEPTTTGGFQKDDDWTSTTQLDQWTEVGSNISIEKVTANFDGNEFAVKIPGRRTSLELTNYIESDPVNIATADYNSINVDFAHWANYPSVVLFGTKPILYFEIIFTETSSGDVYNWSGAEWVLIPLGQTRRRLRIDFNERFKWRRYSAVIDRVPSTGTIKFRFYKLIKSGTEGVTELRLTAWKTNLITVQPTNASLLLEAGSTNVFTQYKGPSFPHIISDGTVLNAAGVMDVSNVLTATWARRGVTESLNIRRLFLTQWLSFNSRPTEILSGTIHQKGEVITPMSVVKDKDTISSVRYVMQSYQLSLGTGIGSASYRELIIEDANINAFQEFVNTIRLGDFFATTVNYNIFIGGAPGLSPGANPGAIDLNFSLNGDVRGGFNQAEITPAAIQNKSRLDLTGLTANDIVFGAVRDTPDQENMTNLRLGDTFSILDSTFVPYTGAKFNVNLGEKGITSGFVKYDVTPTSTPTDQGTTYWDVDDETLAVVMNGTILKVGEDQYYPVKNQTGSLIPKGTAVQFNGTLGASGRLLITPFIANGSVPSTRFMGVTSEAIADGADGKVMWFGRIRGINTNAFNEGDILYASTTVAGGFQTTVPVAPNNIIEVCAVVNKGVNNGIIFVRPQFIEGGSVSAGAGLSIDGVGQVQLGNDGAGVIDYSDDSIFENYIQFSYEDSEKSLRFELLDAESKLRNSFDNGLNSNEAEFEFQASMSGSLIRINKSVNGLSQGLVFNSSDNLIKLTDQINSKGLEYAGDYEANFTARSLVTKQYVDGAVGGGGTDLNAVHYNVADGKNATERNQARVNIGSTSATPQVIATAGAINDLAITSNHLVFTGASVVLSGIVAGLDGEEVTILNASGTNLTILAESVLSTAGNRLNTGLIVPNLSILRIKYRSTTNRWFSENIGVSDGRYLRKDIPDSRDGLLTQHGPIIHNGTTLGGVAVQPFYRLNQTNIASAFFQGFDPSNNQVWSINPDGSANYYLLRTVRQAALGNLAVSAASAFTLGVRNWNSAASIFDMYNNAGTLVSQMLNSGRLFHTRSGASNESVRRDELYLNYSQTVATAGTINNLAINADCKLLVLTGATDLTGVVFVDNTRLLRIEARGGNRIIRHESASSIAANRFSIGADLTINAGEVYQFIYTDSRWRRVL